METNKYYKPSLDEFHIGFEFERLVEMKGGTMIPIEEHCEIWDKEIMNQHNLVQVLAEWPNVMRVKYLDSEDIENLGFSQMQLPCDYVKNNYILYYNVNKNRVRILDLDIVNEGNAVFNGIIRNKSELKRILKMIGAIE